MTPAPLRIRPQLIVLLLVVMTCIPYVVVPNYLATGRLVVRSNPVPRPYMFPSGGRQLFPRYRLIALYGTPDSPVLGALGQQNISASITRVKSIASQYQKLTQEHILPTFEIIATVASESPTSDGDYSYAIPLATLQAWISAARAAGVYVVLDLQSGRASFLHQAQELQGLLIQPNVGLALDPEWRLQPNELPLEQIGSVSISEVNQTSRWLAGLTLRYKLPQKAFVLHEFQLSMLPDRAKLDTSRRELAYIVQMDGQGSQAAKLNTWHDIVMAAPVNVHFGWKNFYKMDTTLRSPSQTLSLSPQPWYISYQ